MAIAAEQTEQRRSSDGPSRDVTADRAWAAGLVLGVEDRHKVAVAPGQKAVTSHKGCAPFNAA